MNKKSKPSNKQIVQRERFAIKGFLASVQSRANGLRMNQHLTPLERTRVAFMSDAATMILKYFDGISKEMIKETKNV